MTDIAGSVHLNLEAIRIIELEGFAGGFVGKIEMKLGQSCSNFISVEICDPEIKMVDGGGLTFSLLDAKEGRPYAQNMHLCRLLLERHPKELLIELRSAMKVGNTHGDVVQSDSTKALWLFLRSKEARSCEGARGQRGEGQCELPAAQLALFHVIEHSFNRLNHGSSGCDTYGPCRSSLPNSRFPGTSMLSPIATFRSTFLLQLSHGRRSEERR